MKNKWYNSWKPWIAISLTLAILTGAAVYWLKATEVSTSPEDTAPAQIDYGVGRQEFYYIGEESDPHWLDPHGLSPSEDLAGTDKEDANWEKIYYVSWDGSIKFHNVFTVNSRRGIFDAWAHENGWDELILLGQGIGATEEDGRHYSFTVSAVQYGRLAALLETEEGEKLLKTLELTVLGEQNDPELTPMGEPIIYSVKLNIIELADDSVWVTKRIVARSKDNPDVFITRNEDGDIVEVDPADLL